MPRDIFEGVYSGLRLPAIKLGILFKLCRVLAQWNARYTQTDELLELQSPSRGEGTSLVLCLINPLTNSKADDDRDSPFDKGGFRGIYSAGDSKSPLPPFFKGGILRKTHRGIVSEFRRRDTSYASDDVDDIK